MIVITLQNIPESRLQHSHTVDCQEYSDPSCCRDARKKKDYAAAGKVPGSDDDPFEESGFDPNTLLGKDRANHPEQPDLHPHRLLERNDSEGEQIQLLERVSRCTSEAYAAAAISSNPENAVLRH